MPEHDPNGEPNPDMPASVAAFLDSTKGSAYAGPGITLAPKPPTYIPRPPAVYGAIAAVMAEMGPVGKDDRSAEGYEYRGIEAVTRKLQALCGKHGVIIWPVSKITGATESPEMRPGWFDWRVEVTWSVAGVDGIALDPCPVTHGIGRDKSDKGINKGMTQAFKYLLLQLFMVSDGKDDPDSHTYDDDRRPEAAPSQYVSAELAGELAGAIKSLTPAQREHVAKVWTEEDPTSSDGESFLPTVDGKPVVGKLTPPMVGAARALILQAKRAVPEDAPSEPASAPDSTPAASAGGESTDDAPEPSAATQAPDPHAYDPDEGVPEPGADGPDYAPGEEPY